ncbi:MULTISPECIES: hypothetical protein [unclassified Crossiella]|uniref:hypothetical protein n=1 Tax=unclassified Crossiella TaxID=2620835 RepID=UPI001FFEB590|nr:MULTISPECIES: hypothetical protein [unclassified Crossiella]MCK2245339.1 hypothetical protein [Crossiella sp. S99.2]MCK2258959.1 hypothetical protein [Crossiella sp. S99.1]
MRPITLSRLLALTLLLSAGLLGTATAQPTATSAGDPRATAFPSNATTCAHANLPGQLITGQLTVNIAGGTHLTVTGVPLGLTVTGIVVKGGPGYNVYLPAGLGLLPWPGLHSPLVGQNGNIPEISHWFACGQAQTTTKPTTSTTTKPYSSSATTKPGSSTAITTTTTSGAGTPSTSTASTPRTTVPTSTPVPVPVANDDNLANTGFDGGWLIGLGAALVVAGGLVLGLTRLRNRRGR